MLLVGTGRVCLDVACPVPSGGPYALDDWVISHHQDPIMCSLFLFCALVSKKTVSIYLQGSYMDTAGIYSFVHIPPTSLQGTPYRTSSSLLA